MGLSTKKSKSTSTMNQNTTMNTTPTNPEWVSKGIEGLAGKIGSTFQNLDPYSLVAGINPLQAQAAGVAAGLGQFGRSMGFGGQGDGAPSASYMTMGRGGASGGGAPLSGGPGMPAAAPNVTDPYGSAMTTMERISRAGPQSIEAVDIAGGIGKFLNPYLKDVVDTSLTNFDEGAGYTRAENQLALAGDTTFGGSGGAIQTALTERGLAQDRAKLAADLRSGGYDRASQLAAQQAAMDLQTRMSNANFGETALQRQLSAAGGLADVGALQGSEARANTSLQFDIGEALRGIQQQQAMAPVGALGMEASLLGQLPFDLFKGSNATGSLQGTQTTKTKESGASLGDWLSYFAANARAAAGAGG